MRGRGPRDNLILIDGTFIGDGSVLDIGSGGGLPGIPIAICRPHQQITLLDSNSKCVWPKSLELVLRASQKNSTVPFAVVDLETTGSVIGVDEIMEIGMVRVAGGRIVDRFTTRLHTQREIPPWVARLTGLSDADLTDSPDLREVAPRVLQLLAGLVVDLELGRSVFGLDVERRTMYQVANHQRGQQLVAREGFGQVLVRTDDASTRLVEETVLAGQHDDRHIAEPAIVLDDGAGLVTVQPRHHDVDENHVRVMIGNL
mgnify:CR=1 FL=1